MEYRVKVATGVKKESVAVGRDGRLLVSVSVPKEEGKANERMRELLAEHFGVSFDMVTIRRGNMSSTKTVFIKS